MSAPRVLILSSHVATSDVGGGAQVVALARRGVESVLVPTVLFGRHPGLGPPGGGPVDIATFESVIGGVRSAGVFETVSAVVCGYFANTDQIAIAAKALDDVRAVSPEAWVVIDPIMGDDDIGLYVSEVVARSVAEELVPQADLLAPNAWELGRLSGRPVTDPAAAVAAARKLGRPVLVSSVPVGEDVGVVFADADHAWLASHHREPLAPRGTGDFLLAAFVASTLLRAASDRALQDAVGAVAEFVGGAPTVIRMETLT